MAHGCSEDKTRERRQEPLAQLDICFLPHSTGPAGSRAAEVPLLCYKFDLMPASTLAVKIHIGIIKMLLLSLIEKSLIQTDRDEMFV
jgi:hypothetical protein